MKRRISLILAGGLISLVAITLFLLGFSPFAAPIKADQTSAVINQSTPVPQVDVEATAQAMQFQNQQAETQVIIQEREAALQSQIAQSRQAITHYRGRR